MMAVAMAASDVRPLLKQVSTAQSSLTVACINSPVSVTISGHTGQLDELAILLEQRQVFHRRLRVDVAYHSPIMCSASMAYKQDVGVLENGTVNTSNEVGTQTIMISTVTGKAVDASTLCQAEYWAQNMTQPVLFSDALSCIWSPEDIATRKAPFTSIPTGHAVDLLVEIGPHSSLESPIREIIDAHSAKETVQYYSAMKRHVPAHKHFLATLGRLSCHGVKINFGPVNTIGDGNPHRRQTRLIENLPEYPFDHSCTYLPSGRLGKSFRFREHAKLDLLGKPVVDWNPLQPRWRNFLKISELPWVKDHKVCLNQII
jgi:acyl transferase domain-containing protein